MKGKKMSSLKNAVKNNKMLYKLLFPIVSGFRIFVEFECKTIVFYIQMLLKKIGFSKCDCVLTALEGRCAGKRIFVVCPGPSLTIEDLNWLDENGEICISCNSIFKLFDYTNWRPDFYLLNDELAYNTYKEMPTFKINNIAKKNVLISERIKQYMKDEQISEKIGFIPVCYFDHWCRRPGKVNKYYSDLKYGNYDLYTVSNMAIALADYLGAKKIYLLGADNDYLSGKTHAGGDEFVITDIQSIIQDQENHELGFRISREANEKKGNKIYNATRGGKLRAFERVDMDEIIRSK